MTRCTDHHGPLLRLRSLARAALLALVLLAAAVPAPAVVGADGARREAFARLVFAPELVMRHQEEIGLRPEQKQELVAELQSTQSDLVPLQVAMSEAAERLAGLLREPRPDEQAVLAAATRVMELESEIKARHLVLLVRIKNLLGSEQQEILRRIREREGPRGAGRR